jgi:NADH-quinone oxidoreductase subunit F
MKAFTPNTLSKAKEECLQKLYPSKPVVMVGMGTCGIGNGADKVYEAFKASGAVETRRTGCFGFCAVEPLVTLIMPGKPALLFASFEPRRAAELLKAISDSEALDRYAKKALGKIEEWDFHSSSFEFGRGFPAVRDWKEIPFFQGQEKVVLRHCGLIDPESINDYIAVGGYSALAKVLSLMSPVAVIDEVKLSKLRGRGGAGFPTGKKWELLRAQTVSPKYLICNADEGDPGAYMNRNEIESDPHMLIEGMTIAAYATGATSGVVYVRAEYPLAVERLGKALSDARERGLLGKDILGTGFAFDLEMVQGAGAFVCGEETALIASIEGKAGRPLPRPPFPAQRGLNGFPTNINNVETYCNVPVILGEGAQRYASIGTAASSGTKVFSLVGKVRNTGLVELPMGTRLDSIVYGMGEGAGRNKRIKAVQTGGPSGGCIPADKFDVAVDYESLASLGAIMGSGGMVVMDRDNCMVDVARYFIGFTSGESCGKCSPCREGLSQMLRILDAVSRGEALEADLDELEALALNVKDSALCGLGQTAANPILTTLKYFREDYLRHIRDKRCDAGVCEHLFIALCENSCPLHMNIPGYLALLQEGRLEEAFELTLRDNPLPGTIGRICHFHCQMRCRRESLDEPVAQGEIHRYLADTMYKMGKEKEVYERLIKEKLPSTGKKLAIVGSGPAGLTAAYFLVRLGHEVTVYDEHEKAGGILRYGIPAYRLPREVIDKETAFIRRLGVRFVFNSKVGRDVPASKLAVGFDAVLICSGARGDKSLGLAGESLSGVYPGYKFLEDFNMKKASKPGDRILIVGGGNVAIDAARTLFRLGCDVTVAYRRAREDMPANASELAGAEEEGVHFMYMASPQEFLDDGTGHVRGMRFMRMKCGPFDASGRPRPVPSGKTFDLDCDAVIVAIGEKADTEGLEFEGLATKADATIAADRFSLQTGALRVYASGDVVSGPATAAEAMGLAKQAVRSIDRDLMGEDRLHLLSHAFSYNKNVPLDPIGGKMNRSRRIEATERQGNFHEIAQGYSGEQALAEALRCLRCDVRENAPKSGDKEGSHVR